MYPASFEYFTPGTVDEALGLLKQYGDDAKLLAGGHSLLPAMKLRLAQPGYVIDLAGVAGLTGIKEEAGCVVIGAMTTHTEVAESALVKTKLTALAEAAALVGDPQVRNRGTIGGSVAHSDPNADEPAALVAFKASFTLVGPKGQREMSAEDFFVDIFTTALEPDEVLTAIRIPVASGQMGSAYRKFPHPASGFVVVSSAVVLVGSGTSCQEARIAMGGLGGKPFKATAAEAVLSGQELTAERLAQAAGLVSEGADPADDLYASAAYKANIAGVYARQALDLATQRLKG